MGTFLEARNSTRLSIRVRNEIYNRSDYGIKFGDMPSTKPAEPYERLITVAPQCKGVSRIFFL
jgi:hypothetical protein